jgi:hypothetical protein
MTTEVLLTRDDAAERWRAMAARNRELEQQVTELTAKAASLREALLNLARVSTDYHRRAWAVPALEETCLPAERLLQDAQHWRTFWDQSLLSRRSLAMYDQQSAELRLEVLAQQASDDDVPVGVDDL